MFGNRAFACLLGCRLGVRLPLGLLCASAGRGREHRRGLQREQRGDARGGRRGRRRRALGRGGRASRLPPFVRHCGEAVVLVRLASLLAHNVVGQRLHYHHTYHLRGNYVQ